MRQQQPKTSKAEVSKKYKINHQNLIFENGCSRIFRGYNLSNAHPIIVKEMSLQKNSNILSLIKEPKLLKQLDHDNIIKIYDYYCQNQECVMFLEEAKYSLRSFTIKEKALAKQTILNYCKQISSGMAYLHSLGILHLDLKPENIMLASDYSIRIIDFGESVQGQWRKLAKDVRATHAYCPPYILNLHDKNQIVQFDESYDIWSFGAIFYQLIFTKPLFDGTNKIKVASQMKAFQRDWEVVLSQEKITDKLYYKILRATLRIDKSEKITFNQIKEMIEDGMKNKTKIKYEAQDLPINQVLPTRKLLTEGDEAQNYQTDRTFFNNKKPIEQSKTNATLICKYIQYFKFRLEEVKLLLKKLSQNSEDNGLAMVMNDIELGIIKISLHALIFQLYHRLNDISLSPVINLPSGEKIEIETIHKMIKFQIISKVFKQVQNEFKEFQSKSQKKQQYQLIQETVQKISKTSKYNKIFPNNLTEFVFKNPNRIMALLLKKYVMNIENLKYKVELNEMTRIQIDPIARRDIYFCSMISALDRIIPQSNFYSTESKVVYNELKIIKGDRLIKEAFKNVLYNLEINID